MVWFYQVCFFLIYFLYDLFLVEAGEKMGLQITVLLTMVIYVEVLQTNIPVFDSYTSTPLILYFFIATILIICICILGNGRSLQAKTNRTILVDLK